MFAEIFTEPEPPMIDPYMVSTKKKVDAIISEAREEEVILPTPK
jgi:hypothetical protein